MARHARAKNVSVSLDSYDRRVVLKIEDDGVGFDRDRCRRGMGTANMQARAEEFGGDFEHVSKPGSGTSVRLSIPCIQRAVQAYWLPNYVELVRWGLALFLIFRHATGPSGERVWRTWRRVLRDQIASYF